MLNHSSKLNGLLSGGGFGVALALLVSFPGTGSAAENRSLEGHVPAAITELKLKPQSRLPGSDPLHLVIGLPLRNQDGLTNLLAQIYNPASTNFHHYLNPAQFTARFGPTEQDYQRVVNFAKTNGLAISRIYGDRVLLEVSAPVSAVESAFHVTLRTYSHPTEARRFYAPDAEPSVDAGVPIRFISGLNNYTVPRPMGHIKQGPVGGGSLGGVGSAPDGKSFIGSDFRNAYVPGTGLYGGGEKVGLVEFNGYFLNDITNYEGLAGIYPYVPIQNVPLEGFTGPVTTGNGANGVAECSADIELVIAMAPFLNQVVVFEGTTNSLPDPILSSMVASNQILQFSSSWEMSYDPVAEGYLMQMASQGQSFCMASGDGGAYLGGPWWPSDDPFVTSVGGTELTMSGHGATYVSETVWNTWNGSTGGISGGGISALFGIPFWQQGVNLTAVGGSLFQRNVPDVALVADDVWINYDHTTATFSGTSCGAPLWAGFTALVNEYCAAVSKPPIGLVNPGLYAIGEGGNYGTCFNDITNGNSVYSGGPNEFYSARGYDLCTGWGTPKPDLIGYLSLYAGATNVVYADFHYAGSTQNGSYNMPFKTVAGATSAVTTGGTVVFKTSGSSSETMTISKSMTMTSIGGAATIGN